MYIHLLSRQSAVPGSVGFGCGGSALGPLGRIHGHVLRILRSGSHSHCSLLLPEQPQPQCTVRELPGPASSSVARAVSYPWARISSRQGSAGG